MSTAKTLDVARQQRPISVGDPSGVAGPSRRTPISLGTIEPSVATHSVREAGRINAMHISEREHKDLLDERATLLKLKFTAPLTRRQQDRLEYVRWSLDRIEDAQHGHKLDRLEMVVAQYQDAIRQVQQLNSDLSRYLPAKR